MITPPVAAIPTLPSLPSVIETPRLRLRLPQDGDAEALFALAVDPDVSRYVTWAPPTKVDETREFLGYAAKARELGTDMIWIIERAGSAIGCIGLHDITWGMRAVRYDNADLGYWLGKPAWGQGVMTEAATHVTRWAFETLGLHKVVVSCFEPNIGSKKVIEKVGYRFLCRQEEDIWRDGTWHAHLRYELTISEWTDTSRTLRFTRAAG
jgi:ribosomal-protein-alanine N-acetyltransferase